mmetsp:Transcript_6564/g.13236  ORF Transcript_6564/g.13236 Transcript_6564/m.13236 type:complete len:288 (+) Transcript_6564:7838-8701(+)
MTFVSVPRLGLRGRLHTKRLRSVSPRWRAVRPEVRVGGRTRLAVKSGAIGVLAGLVGTLVGAGGGVITTPLAVAWLGLTQHQAHGTSLTAVTASAVFGTAGYFAHGGFVDRRAAALITATALLTAPAGAAAATHVTPRRLRRYFGVFLVVVALLLQTRRWWSHGLDVQLPFARMIGMPILGAITGFLSGLLGIGGGTVVVPALTLLLSVPQKLAQGTALAAMILPSMVGARKHFMLGNVSLPLVPGLCLGSIVGSLIGGGIATQLADESLRIACSIVFFLVGIRYAL